MIIFIIHSSADFFFFKVNLFVFGEGKISDIGKIRVQGEVTDQQTDVWFKDIKILLGKMNEISRSSRQTQTQADILPAAVHLFKSLWL